MPPEPTDATPGLLVEVAGHDFVGALVRASTREVVLRNRRGVERVFRNDPGGFRIDDVLVTLRPVAALVEVTLTRSGSLASSGPARVARASRIWVEGTHDAELLEHVWGDDLRHVGVVVEPIGGIDEIEQQIADFDPGPTRRLGVLVDHLVPGSKEEQLCRPWLRGAHPDVLVTGHPHIDILTAVDPRRMGLDAWPEIPRGTDYKRGICDALGFEEPWQLLKVLLDRVRDVHDLDRALWRAVEQLLDHVTIEDAVDDEGAPHAAPAARPG